MGHYDEQREREASMSKDITACVNNYCPLRLVCHRFLFEHKAHGQSLASFKYQQKGTAWYCEHHIPVTLK